MNRDRLADPYNLGPPTLVERVDILLRFLGVIAAAVPTTTLPPLLWNLLWYRRFKDEARLQRAHKMSDWAAFCLRHILQADVRAFDAERLPSDQRRLMFISNHQSYIDIPAIMGSLPVRAFLSKDLVAYIPVIGLTAYVGGTIYMRRGARDSRKKALEETLRMCEESVPVVVFPEGSRSRTGELAETIRPGAIQACWERQLRVATFGVDGTGCVVPPSMDRVRTGERVAIVVGPTFDPGDFASAETFVEATWTAVKQCFARARALRSSPEWPLDGVDRTS